MLEDFDPNSIQDENARQAILRLFNLIEDLAAENRKLREENQRLRDENNRLKGEQGKPKIKPSKKTIGSQANYSSERERYKPKQWKKASKAARIEVNREEAISVDPVQLPRDAEFKGYEDVVVQDIKIETDNVRFRKEK
jgi:regulator of replication initiation timing